MTNIQDDQNVQNQPKKADVDELLKQLEALNQEIASKTVADQAQLEEKKDQPETLEAPPSSPALESSDEPQLPSGDQDSEPKKDLDLDKFINDLEAKIAEKDGGATQVEEPKPEKFQPAEPQLRPAEIQEEQPNLQENFSRQRPSLDLSGVEEKPAPSLTLNNGQLEENKEDKTGSPTLTLDSEPAPTSNDEEVNQEDLESQNIFTMLGLENLEETEKEAFLADLEQLIWDNFIEVELPLLLNSEQKAQAEQILADNSKTEDERKEALLVYVEKFIPNLEEVMYKKALSLKKEMFEERLKKMRDQATEENNLSLMADLDQVRELVAADRYKTATELLNKA